MAGRYNLLKLRALSAFEYRGWLSPPEWAAKTGFQPVRAAYSYLKRLHKWKLLDRAVDNRYLLHYRLNDRGAERLAWLRSIRAHAR